MDPVIAYMDAYEAACRVFNQKSTSDLEKTDPAAFEKLENELMATRHEALRTVPTSLEGLMRQARYHRELNMSPNERTHDKDVDHFLRQMPGVLDALFNGPKNDRLMELIEERKHLVAAHAAISAEADRIYAAADAKFPAYAKHRDTPRKRFEQHPDAKAYHDALLALGEGDRERRSIAAHDRVFKNECQIARCKVRSFQAAAALSEILALGINSDPMSIVNDENFQKIVRNLAAFLTPPTAKAAVSEISIQAAA